MTELSGSFEAGGLPVIARFLIGLHKTGCLRVVHEQWHGDIFFEAGQVVAATLEDRRGLPAFDALLQTLSAGEFEFVPDVHAPAGAEIGLTRQGLEQHLAEVGASPAVGGPKLPSLD